MNLSYAEKIMLIELLDDSSISLVLSLITNKYYYESNWFSRFYDNGIYIQIHDNFRFSCDEISQIIDTLQGKSLLSREVLRKRLCCFLVFIGRKISYRDLSKLFETSVANVHQYIRYMVYLLLKFKNEVISLPTTEEFEALSIGFRNKSDFEGTILAIDGTHVPITNVTTTLGRYINRKGVASLNFLVACDFKYRIRYVYGGTFGSSHDAFVYNSSGLSEWGENVLKEPVNGKSYHMVGDAAYPRKTYLVTPYKGCLTPDESRFNRLIIPQRILIERTFGYFKSKFQKFRHEIVKGHLPFTSQLFHAACVIYNLTIDNRMSEDLINLSHDIMQDGENSSQEEEY